MLRCLPFPRALGGLLLVAVLLVGFMAIVNAEGTEPPPLGIPEEARQIVGGKIYTLWIEGDGLLEAGDLAGADGKYRAAYDLGMRVNDHAAIALSALSLGDCKARGGDYDQAIDWYRTSLGAYTKVRDPSSRMYSAVTWQNLGNAYRELGNDAEAREAYEDGVSAVKDVLPSLSGDAACYANHSLSYLYAKLGDAYGGAGSRAAMEAYAEAVEYSGRAADCYRRRGQEQASSLSETKQFLLTWLLGDACYSVEDYQLGLAAYQEAVDLWERFDISEACLDVELLFGVAYGHLKLDHANEAAEALDQASRIDRKKGCELDEELGYTYLELASLFYDEESYTDAARWAGEAAAKHLSLNNNSDWAFSKYIQGLSHGSLNQHREAIACLEEIVEPLQADDPNDILQHTLEWLAYCRCQLTYASDESGSLRVATSCITRDVDDDNCPTDEASSFTGFDEKAVCWVAFDGTPRNEEIRFVFIAPDGFVYHEGVAQAQWQLHWYWIWIRGEAAASKTGTWTVKVYIDDELEAEMHFELRLF